MEESCSFITRQKESGSQPSSRSPSADPQLLRGKQLQAYQAVQQHQLNRRGTALRIIISGTAGTGKSLLINCLTDLLRPHVKVAAPTGVAAFNIYGSTLHTLLHLPTRGEFRELEGDRLKSLQSTFEGVQYLITDEMSMVGRKMFGRVDKRLRQAFPHSSDQVLGGCSCLLFGDFGQLPPVFDLPLYTTLSRSIDSDLGRATYQAFDKADTLTQVMRQSGQDQDQVRFRELLLRLRDGQVTQEDWELLMTRSAANVADTRPFEFENALHLHPLKQSVAEHNALKLRQLGRPVAAIKAIHSGTNASKATTDDAQGLEPIVHLEHGARVVLIANLWVEAGLVNGAMGTVHSLCYRNGGPLVDHQVFQFVFWYNLTDTLGQHSTRIWYPFLQYVEHGCMAVPLVRAFRSR